MSGQAMLNVNINAIKQGGVNINGKQAKGNKEKDSEVVDSAFMMLINSLVLNQTKTSQENIPVDLGNMGLTQESTEANTNSTMPNIDIMAMLPLINNGAINQTILTQLLNNSQSQPTTANLFQQANTDVVENLSTLTSDIPKDIPLLNELPLNNVKGEVKVSNNFSNILASKQNVQNDNLVNIKDVVLAPLNEDVKQVVANESQGENNITKLNLNKDVSHISVYENMTANRNSNDVHVKVIDNKNKLDNDSLTQIADKIAYNISKDKSEFKLQLFPKELGKISVNLISQKGQLSIEFIAENPKTQSILLANMSDIKALINQDLKPVFVAQTSQEKQQAFYNQEQRNQNQDNKQQQNNHQNEIIYEEKNDDDKITASEFITLMSNLRLMRK